jgi:hypothetical protein
VPGKKLAKERGSKRRRSRKPDKSNDGGAWALFGYLYQFIGSALWRIEAKAGGIFRIEMETGGQDLVQSGPSEIKLVQFKFSQNGTDISPSELAEILRRLKQSTESLGNVNKPVRWVLQTNRSLAPSSVSLMNADVPTGKSRTKPADMKLISEEGSKLEHIVVNPNTIREGLQARAKRFGVTDYEHIPGNVGAYFLEILHNPEGHRVIQMADLDAQLAEYKQPRSLYALDIKDFAKQELSNAAVALNTPLDTIIPRLPIQSIIQRKDLAIAIITGHGGCGKTRSVLRSLSDYLDNNACLAAALMPGPAPVSESFTALVERWRCHLADAGEESLQRSLERLRVANEPIARPILLLNIDAIDEAQAAQDHRKHLLELIQHFWQLARNQSGEPEVMLVISCRTRKTFDEFVQVEGLPVEVPRGVEEVELGDFFQDEFADVWNLWFKDVPAPRIGRTRSPQRIDEREPELNKSTSSRLPALAHPALLQCVRYLSDGERADLLNNADSAWGALVAHYVGWFASKVRRRIDLDLDSVKAILRSVSSATEAADASYERDSHWLGPVAATQLPSWKAAQVFQEAVSCGLVLCQNNPIYEIATGNTRWRWRFDFLPLHLKNLE